MDYWEEQECDEDKAGERDGAAEESGRTWVGGVGEAADAVTTH